MLIGAKFHLPNKYGYFHLSAKSTFFSTLNKEKKTKSECIKIILFFEPKMFALKYFYENLLLQKSLVIFSKRTKKLFDARKRRKKWYLIEKYYMCVWLVFARPKKRKWSLHKLRFTFKKKWEEKHENEIIEIKMVLNITHGATNTFVHMTIERPIRISRFIYFTGHFFYIFDKRAPPYTHSSFKITIFSTLFELSHFIRVDKTFFTLATTTKKNAIVTVVNVQWKKPHWKWP